MKRLRWLARLGLTVLLAATGVSATAARDSTVRDSTPSIGQVEAARAALAAADVDRLLRDEAYAVEIIRHLDVLVPLAQEPDERVAVDTLRLYALMILRRPEEIRAIADRIVELRPMAAEPYGAAWWALLSVPDYPRAVAVLDAASRRIRDVDLAGLREVIGPELPAELLVEFQRQDDDATRLRFAEALFRIGWPGGSDLELSSWLRSILIGYHLDRGDSRGAAELAAGLSDPAMVLPMLLLHRYDEMLGPDADRMARLRTVIAEYDMQTRAALGDAPGAGPTLQRARFLRSLGRDREALALYEPFTRDVAATVAADDRGMWVINDAAHALLALDRKDEAVALMERLVALPVAENSALIGPIINHAIVLGEAGRHEEALAYATRIERELGEQASVYGRMVIAASIVCSLAKLDRGDEAGESLERLRAQAEEYPGPLTSAYLCLGDLDAAETLVIRRLQEDEPETLLLAFQDYQLERDVPSSPDPESERLRSLRERPAVRAVLEQVGRIMELPLASAPSG